MLTSDSRDPAATAASTDSVGSTHSDPRTYSDSASRRIISSPPARQHSRGPVSTKDGAHPRSGSQEGRQRSLSAHAVTSVLTWGAAGSEDPPHTGATIGSEHQQRDGELN